MASRRESKLDVDFNHPPFSRLFIIHARGVEEASIREAFEKYGQIQDFYMVKDRRTMETKGFSYVKYEKTSEAALAMEELNGTCMDGSHKPVKVVLANNRGEGNYRDPHEDEKMLRLFVMIPKDYTNKDLRKNFEEFGDIDFVEIVKDRKTGKGKGFGYVKYLRAYHAALALEKCEKKFRAKFADPLGSRDRDRDLAPPLKRGHSGREPYDDYYDDRHDRGRRRPSYNEPMSEPMPMLQNRGLMEQMQLQANMGMGDMGMRGDRMGMGGGMGMTRGMGMGMGMSDGMGMGGLMADSSMTMMSDRGGSTEVEAMVTSSHVVRPMLEKLFDLIPGLDYFNFDRNSGSVVARYSTPEAASRCVDKMNGFEYPPGNPMAVRFASRGRRGNEAAGRGGNMDVSAIIENLKGVPNAGHLVSAMKQIAEVFEGRPSSSASPFTESVNPDGTENVPYTSRALPPKQPLLAPDSECMERLFLVCKPFPVNETILIDAFRRFGNLIEVYLQQGKNFGYARYGCKESAAKAIDALNLLEVNGQFLKVLVAEPQKRGERDYSPNRKRTRNSEHWES